jgi:probable F420-dependent oxidoreductase
MRLGLHALGIGTGARREVIDAATTRRIHIATGILLLPEHNPVLVAKQAATLDLMSGGRLTLGVGIGWSEEEFAALGVPFARRGPRAAEYVAAMRALCRDDVASFEGEFVRFDAVRVNPPPVRDRRIPIVVGGNSDPALRRHRARRSGRRRTGTRRGSAGRAKRGGRLGSVARRPLAAAIDGA